MEKGNVNESLDFLGRGSVMSAAASAVVVPGWSQIPNSFIENQALFTAAERAMVLAVIRVQNNHSGKSVAVSDQTWKKWTGLEPRTKEAAVAGLRGKCLLVNGRGETARYSFAREQWDTFVRTVARGQYRPRTAGRGVDPKPGAKIHPTCRERGCGLLANPGPELVTPDTAIPNAQRVARNCDAGGADTAPGEVSGRSAGNGLIPFPSASIPQRVARTMVDGAGELWGRTLAALQAIFPLVDMVFLVRLVAVVRAVFADIRDAELAEAVGIAYTLRNKIQRTEGLFLLTVPRAVAAMRAGHAAVGAIRRARGPSQAAEDGRGLLEGIRMLQDRVIEALRARGAPFADHVAELVKLRETVVDGADLEVVCRTMGEIERKIVPVAVAELTQGERGWVELSVQATLKPYRALWSAVQLAELRARTEEDGALATLGIPRLSQFYV